MDFDFHMPVRMFSGEGCLLREGDFLRTLGKRCLVVTGAHGAQASGALNDALTVLDRLSIEATVFPGIGENPLVSQCQAGAWAAETTRASFVLGIGGGSAMDAAKAIAWLAANPIDDVEGLFASRLRQPPLPLALVGTTAGTGSEVSAVSVLTMDDTGRKRSFQSPLCYARAAFADPRYTFSLPRAATVSTALDALSHAVEGWFSPACGDVITTFGEKALLMLSEGLWWLAQNDGLPPAEQRERLLYGSLWAGMVLNATGTAFPHPFGYVLTEWYGLPHGMASAVFLKAFTRRAQRFAPQRAERMLRLCGGEERYYTILDRLVEYDITMTREEIARAAERFPGLKHFARTPGGFTPEEGKALFRELFLKS